MSKFIELSNPTRTPDSETIINIPSQLPIPTDTGDGLGVAYRLEDNKVYVFGATMTLSYPIVLSNNALYSSWTTPISYNGSGAFFRNNVTTPLGLSRIIEMRLVGDDINEFADITAGEGITVDHCFIANFGGSYIKTEVGYIRNVTIEEQTAIFDWGFTNVFYYNGILQYTTSPIGDALNKINKDVITVAIGDLQITPISDDSAFDIDPLLTGRITIAGKGGIDKSFGGIMFKAGSLDETDPRVNVSNFSGVSDSHVIGSFYMEGNLTPTTAPLAGDGVITNFEDAGGGNTRILTINTPAGGSTVWIIDDNYTGMYTTSNTVLNTSFEIVKEYDSAGTGFWESGWTKILGTTLPRKNEEAAQTDNNELTFYNIEERDVVAHMNINARNNLGAVATDREYSVMKNGTNRLKMSKLEIETTNKTKSGSSSVPTTIINGDTLSLYTRNISTSNAMLPVGAGLVVD